jgi:Tfp pilus assembly protein PilF
VAVAALLFGRPPRSAASSRLPADPGEVLETLPYGASDARAREVASLRRALAKEPASLPAAIRLARLDIQLARERSDPRYLGRAQAALAPWWGDPAAPVDVLVLRATIEQSLHDFEGALADLDRALRLAPDHAQAWITRAVVLTVRGRYEEARQSCVQLIPLASNLVVAVCRTGIDAVTGDAGGAYARLEQALARAGRVAPDEEAWARSSLAEYAVRAGRFEDAERHFRRTLEIDAEDGYVRAAYADLLLDRDRAPEAAQLLRGREQNDTLLLRLAIAEQRTKAAGAQGHIQALADRFEASRARGDVVHRREEARFWLELRGDAARALALAKDNWDVQKEPWDVRVFLEAARAANAPKEAEKVLAWLETTKLEDPFIAKVAAALRSKP